MSNRSPFLYNPLVRFGNKMQASLKANQAKVWGAKSGVLALKARDSPTAEEDLYLAESAFCFGKMISKKERGHNRER